MKKYLNISIFILITLLFSSFYITDIIAASKIKVSVSVAPQAYFVERIGGEKVKTQVMIPTGVSPATYDPTPRQMVMLSKSRIYVKVGVPSFPFEKKHLKSILEKNKRMIVVDMSKGINCRFLDSEKNIKDPHIWLSPSNVKIASKNIYNALIRLDPANKEYYKNNLDHFLDDINKLDKKIIKLLSGKKGFTFMVFHPAWGYFAEEYGIKQLPIEVEGKSPSASRIKKMIDIAKKKGIKIIFVQKGFDTKNARAIAEDIGGKVYEIDPLAKDWLKNMEDVAKIISKALKR